MLLGEAVADIRARLNEKLPRFWQPEELIRWINQAQIDIARRAEYLQVTHDIAVNTTDQEYTCPADILRITVVEFTPTGTTQVHTLEHQDIQGVDEFYGLNKTFPGYPSYFTVWGFPPNVKITLFPKPSMAGVLKLYYYQIPPYIENESNVLAIPDGWYDLVAHYCEYTALRKDRDPAWKEAKALYEEALDGMISLTRRYSDQAGTMHSTSGRNVPAWLSSFDY